MFDPGQMPRIQSRHLRGVFRGNIAFRARRVYFRGEYMKAAINPPSIQKQAAFGAFSQDIIEFEMMLALPFGSEAPKPNTSEEVRLYADDESDAYTPYRIVSVVKHDAEDCYILSLASKKAARG